MLARYPDLPVVIDHGAKPQIAGGGIDGLGARTCARSPPRPAPCLQAVGPGHRGRAGLDAWTRLRPYVEVLLEAFGAKRLMWGSDWPVLNLNGDYAGWLAAAQTLLAGLSDDGARSDLRRHRQRFYGLDH